MDVIFYDEEDTAPVRKVAPPKQSLFSKLVIRTGIAKTVAQAEQIMLIAAIVMLVLTVGVVLIGNSPPGSVSPAALQAANAKLQLESLQTQQQTQGAGH